MTSRMQRVLIERHGLPFALVCLFGFLAIVAACGSSDDEYGLSATLGGEATRVETAGNAFGLSAPTLTNLERRTFEIGDSFFTQNWVTAPASTDSRDGLGPTFNAAACASCHVRDGRGLPPDPDRPGTELGLLLRLSIPGADPETGRPLPDPNYGGQLQDQAILDVEPEGRMVITHETITGTYGDGSTFELIRPTHTVTDLAFGPLADNVMIGPRLAPAVFGVGLLEAIPDADLLALADPDDADGDGISGRVNMVWDLVEEDFGVGRFGWKANITTVEQQVAEAFHGDIGITSVLIPEQNCPPAQVACDAAPNGTAVTDSGALDQELTTDRLGKVTFYNRTLAVPAMRDFDDPQVQQGWELFQSFGCASCHTPTHTTGQVDVEALSNQVIHPFTDLLLHDMGPGLADGRPDGDASGSEWRTPPLWGLGLIDDVNGARLLLHDGRARTIEEAILWHGGEASAAAEAFRLATAEERSALLAFLEAL